MKICSNYQLIPFAERVRIPCSVDVQVYERAMEVHGSEEEMENVRLKKVERREKQQQKKFDKNVQGCKPYIICNEFDNDSKIFIYITKIRLHGEKCVLLL